jgi:hypothetical protein
MSSSLSNDFSDFRRFVEQELAAGEKHSLEQCLQQWRASQLNLSVSGDPTPTPFERASRLGLIGCIDNGPHDLATNPRHMEAFGES